MYRSKVYFSGRPNLFLLSTYSLFVAQNVVKTLFLTPILVLKRGFYFLLCTKIFALSVLAKIVGDIPSMLYTLLCLSLSFNMFFGISNNFIISFVPPTESIPLVVSEKPNN